MRELFSEFGQKRKGVQVYEKFLVLRDYLRQLRVLDLTVPRRRRASFKRGPFVGPILDRPLHGHRRKPEAATREGLSLSIRSATS
jgi:hypothetical protein